ncbi:MAG: prolipoprotein diacylglyceryl transferase [Flammeovirgaceae bacterium]|nr:prolipoprotein diacylglyceryl transferase [Flammeovirgaceae bacterium]
MHPKLFELGGITLYSYGAFIALGVLLGVAYLVIQGKKDVGLTFDQANTLFLIIFISAFVGGKVFFYFENPGAFSIRKFFSGNGFVFYGSFLFAVPAMLWFFKKHKLDAYKMLDVMAVVTCIVHMFGRIGCFMAGCCYGIPTDSVLGVVFTDAACKARPLDTPLVPTQLLEASFIFIVMIGLLIIKRRFQKFKGQLFLIYLGAYAVGRSVLEIYRGDVERGFVIENWLSHSQFIALLILIGVALVYKNWSARNSIKR